MPGAEAAPGKVGGRLGREAACESPGGGPEGEPVPAQGAEKEGEPGQGGGLGRGWERGRAEEEWAQRQEEVPRCQSCFGIQAGAPPLSCPCPGCQDCLGSRRTRQCSPPSSPQAAVPVCCPPPPAAGKAQEELAPLALPSPASPPQASHAAPQPERRILHRPPPFRNAWPTRPETPYWNRKTFSSWRHIFPE